jgi:YVTN family beta-propeller protein
MAVVVVAAAGSAFLLFRSGPSAADVTTGAQQDPLRGALIRRVTATTTTATTTTATTTTAAETATEATVDDPRAGAIPPAVSSAVVAPTTILPADDRSAAERALTLLDTIGGDIAPKSVVASGHGRFVAQNMMYRHTVTVYDRAGRLLATIPDTVDLSVHGWASTNGTWQGAPVEAAFTSGGRYVYVSNYAMYGPGFANPGGDGCDGGGWDESFVYRLDLDTARIDQVIGVGAVPKYVAVTPDDRYVLVTNWCGFDLSVIDTAAATEVARVPLGRHPRGIAITADSGTAYVGVMGSRDIAVVDLASFAVSWIGDVGVSPRHLVLSPDDRSLYVTLNGEGMVAKVDLATGAVAGRVATGRAPRSMAISDDGTALYVVNYNSDTLSKVRTDDMVVIEEVATGGRPIGVTYDAGARQVWVANYSGSIQVFGDG